MAARNEHLIVIMLEHTPFNLEFEIWPQHITIVPWFPCRDETKLDRILADIAARHQAFEVITGESEHWGKKEKYEVITVDDPEAKLHDLHQAIYNSLEAADFPVHQKDFLGDKYRPHVTIRNEFQKHQPHLARGQKVTIEEFSLVRQVRMKKTGRMIKSLKKNYKL